MPDLALALPLAVPALRPQTLLLVEDSRHAAEAVRLMARRLGLRLRRAETLEAARRHLRVYRPDTVLVDLGLPDGPGLALIAELAAARPRLRRIVAVSADPDGAAGALAAGADGFVAKPLRMPGDLGALLGLPDAVAGGGPPGGADPLALRDDLLRARAALAGAAPRDYALGFVQGLALCAGDEGLGREAARARHSGESAGLLAALAARTGGMAGF